MEEFHGELFLYNFKSSGVYFFRNAESRQHHPLLQVSYSDRLANSPHMSPIMKSIVNHLIFHPKH